MWHGPEMMETKRALEEMPTHDGRETGKYMFHLPAPLLEPHSEARTLYGLPEFPREQRDTPHTTGLLDHAPRIGFLLFPVSFPSCPTRGASDHLPSGLFSLKSLLLGRLLEESERRPQAHCLLGLLNTNLTRKFPQQTKPRKPHKKS